MNADKVRSLFGNELDVVENEATSADLLLVNKLFAEYAGNMSVWQEQFLTSLKDRLERGIPLSEKQASILHRVWGELKDDQEDRGYGTDYFGNSNNLF